MLAFFSYVVAALMTAVALWRFPAVFYGDAHRRALWSCYAGFAVALWIKSPAIKSALNRSPITDLSVLLKHYVSILAILAILTYVVANYGKSVNEEHRLVAATRRVERLAYQASIGAFALLTLLFFTVVDRPKPSVDFVAEHAGEWGATLYMSVFYVYLGAAVVICGYQWTKAAARAETRLLRAGLILMAVAMGFGILYTVCRTAFIWTAVVVDMDLDLDRTITHGTDVLQLLVFIFFAAGVSIPTAGAAAHRLRLVRALWDLYPLWHDLLTAVPAIGFARPASRLREIARASPPLEVRVDRWIQDIADAVEQLRHYAPPLLLDAAEEATAGHEDAPAAAEAHWINAALVAAAAGERYDHASAALPTKPISDSAAEAVWLQRVQAVYATLTAAQGQHLLRTAKEPA